uniref:C2H2-type domain-containing protein n=1 Tax=Anopheles coluzzii TaxID=1518534 RepID=A0A6E8W5B6_ANOCL
MCLECFDSLRRSADFRNACIRNEPTFHQLCVGPSTSDNHGLAKNTQDVDPLEVQIEVLRVETELFDEDTQAPDSDKETPNDDDFTWHESETDPARDGKQKLVLKKRPNRKRAGAEQITRRDPAREAKSSSTGGRSARVLCSICGTFVSNLNFHQNYHHAKTSIKLSCPHCPAKITHQKNLTRHINTVHLKIVEKTCEICGKEFTTNNSYVSHMVRRYIARWPYACSQCPKRFKSRFARKTHELTHSGVLFKCTLCEKSYRYKSLLSMHMRKMHPEENTHNEEESI